MQGAHHTHTCSRCQPPACLPQRLTVTYNTKGTNYANAMKKGVKIAKKAQLLTTQDVYLSWLSH